VQFTDGVTHKNLRNFSGIRSTSRAAAGRNVTDLRCWLSDAPPPAFGYAEGGKVCSRGG